MRVGSPHLLNYEWQKMLPISNRRLFNGSTDNKGRYIKRVTDGMI